MTDDREHFERRRWRDDMERIAFDHRWRLRRQRDDARSDVERQRADARDELDDLRRDARDDISGARTAPGHRTPEQERLDEILHKAAAVLVLPLAVLPLAAGHLSALLVNGGWPRYPLSQAPFVVGRLVSDPVNPTGAWAPVNTGTPVPGPVAFWAVFALLAAATAWFLWRLSLKSRSDARRERGPQWATERDLRPLRVRRGEPYRLVLGTNRRAALAVRSRHSLLVVGPAHSGKTGSIAVPALLEWPGPAVVATAKRHLIDETIGWRSQQGEVQVFDPAGTGRYRPSRWSLLAMCETWSGAIRTARDLALAARASVTVEPSSGDLAGILHSDLWSSAMATSLAPYLLAGAASGRSVVDVASWIERDERDEVTKVLERIDQQAAKAHETTFLRDDPARSAFFHVIYQVLSVYKDPKVADSAARHEIIPDELFEGGGHHTLYLTAPEHDQARFRPLCGTVVRQVLAGAYERAASDGRTLRSPLLLLLDHGPGVAPLSDLASLASSAASQGVQVVSIFQSLAQIEDQYRGDAPLVIDNHRAKLLLPSRHGQAAADLLPAGLAEQLRPGEAALLYGNRVPARVRLRPWHRDRELRRRRKTEQDAFVPPPRPGSGPEPHLEATAEQVDAWMRARSRGAPEPPVSPIEPEGTIRRSMSNVFAVREHEGTVPPPENVTPITRATRRPQQ